MKYCSIYKCRLCGKLYEDGCTGSKGVVLANMSHVVFDAPIDKNTGMLVNATTMHWCEDGSYGMADFQGFKAVDNN